MAKSVLIVYEPVSEIKERKNYWQNYISFYEQYWDGPSTPKSPWFGREYDDFKDSISKHLDLDIDEVEDCFFLKDENDKYYISPLNPKNFNILVCEDVIPLPWFAMFEEGERKFFYTHTGFGAIDLDGIYYKTNLASSRQRIREVGDIIGKTSGRLENNNDKSLLLPTLTAIKRELEDLENWLTGFDQESLLLLNYGEISSLIHPQTFKNENTAMELWQFLSLLESEKFEEAKLKLNLINQKWDEIRSKASGEIEKSRIQ